MKRLYRMESRAALEQSYNPNPEILEASDLLTLPPVVRKYLQYAGVIGKEKVYNFRVLCRGVIRSNPQAPWMKLRSEQINTCGENPARVFYIKALKMGLPAFGVHLYKNASATMKIKLAGIFTLVDAKGPEMDQGETATVLAEMCYMAPATLIDKNIRWEILDDKSVRAIYSNGKHTISGILYFNEVGALINFISHDRFDTDGKTFKSYPWVAPAKEYTQISGYRLASGISLIYRKPEGDFCYGVFYPTEMAYNIK